MGPYPNQKLIQGQVHHLSAEEAQENPEVVIGMFPVNNKPSTILFDSGASHSFVSRSFNAQNKFSCSLLEKYMMVQSPGSLLKTNMVCRGLKIDIRGVIFPATLVAIESAKLDVILGMDWLTKHQVCINCATREVSLINPEGQAIQFFARRTMPKKEMVFSAVQ
jgi:hypothetical protein